MTVQPHLSVLILTYNQEKYIEQAVRSALDQRTDFPFEIVVGEDCSRDGTRDVLRRLDAEHPGRLRLLFRDRNLGLVPNFMDTYSACRGEYVATLGGDDYWTDPSKLARQVAILDADPGCSVCYHRVRIVDESGRPSGALLPVDAPRITAKADILRMCHIPALSAVLRKSALPALPPWMARLKIDDWPLYILLSEVGYFVLLDEVLADYRCHGGGFWSGRSDVDRASDLLEMFYVFDQELGREHHDYTADARNVLATLYAEASAIKASLSWRLIRAVLAPFERFGAARVARAFRRWSKRPTPGDQARTRLCALARVGANGEK